MKIYINDKEFDESDLNGLKDESKSLLSIESSSLDIFMTDLESEFFSYAVSNGIALMLDSSRYAPKRIKLKLDTISAWFLHAEKRNFLVSKQDFQENTLKQWDFLSFPHILGSWNKQIISFMKDLQSEHPSLIVSGNNNNWHSVDFIFSFLDENERKNLMTGNKFFMSNSTSLIGLCKPDYFHSGNLHFSVNNGDFKFKSKGSESQSIIDNYAVLSDKASLNLAREAWSDLETLDSACSLMKSLLIHGGVDEDLDFINDDFDFDFISSVFNDFKMILNSPSDCLKFIEKYKVFKKENKSEISVSFN